MPLITLLTTDTGHQVKAWADHVIPLLTNLRWLPWDKNPQHCITDFHVSAIPQPPHPPFLCCDLSCSTLSTLNFFPWNALLCVAKSHSIFKTQTKHHLPLSHPLPTLMVLRTSTTLCSPARSHLIVITCIFIHLHIGLWVLGQGLIPVCIPITQHSAFQS